MEFSPSSVAGNNIVSCVSIEDDRGGIYWLWNNRRLVAVKLLPRPGTYAAKAIPEKKDPYFHLEIIQSVISDLSFHRENGIVLVGQENGSYRPVYRKFTLGRAPVVPAWAPRIEESDIEVVWWLSVCRWVGRWKGKKVIVTTALFDMVSGDIEDMLNGYKLMEDAGLGYLTLPLLGHVIREGQVVGITTDIDEGRVVTPSDRNAILEILITLQRSKLLITRLSDRTFLVTDRGILITDLAGIAFYEDEKKLTEDARPLHWDKLHRIFYGAMIYHDNEYPSHSASHPIYPVVKIPSVPSVATFITVSKPSSRFHKLRVLEIRWEAITIGFGPRVPNNKVRMITIDEEEETRTGEEKPLAPSLLQTRRRIHIRAVQHPYHRREGSRKVLLGPDMPDGT